MWQPYQLQKPLVPQISIRNPAELQNEKLKNEMKERREEVLWAVNASKETKGREYEGDTNSLYFGGLAALVAGAFVFGCSDLVGAKIAGALTGYAGLAAFIVGACRDYKQEASRDILYNERARRSSGPSEVR